MPSVARAIRVVEKGDDWVVIDKPAGLLSVPGKGFETDPEKADCASARVAAMFPFADGPLVVHRLDMDTSGLLVFGLTRRAQKELSMQFEARTVAKRYIALVRGGVTRESGVIDVPIRVDLDNRPVQIPDRARGKPSETRYRVIGREIDRTRLALTPVTGRSHQLRVHCALPTSEGGLGHAIVNDPLYPAPPFGEPEVDAHELGGRLALHAERLSFNEPGTKRRVEAVSAAEF